MEKITHRAGVHEIISTKKEKADKKKFHGKKAKDLTPSDVQELVFALAKKNNLL